MIRRCYRCNIIFGEKEPLDDRSETHGLCDPCFILEMNDIEAALKRIRDAGWVAVHQPAE